MNDCNECNAIKTIKSTSYFQIQAEIGARRKEAHTTSYWYCLLLNIILHFASL